MIPDPRELITTTLGGETFKTCRFCEAHLLHTIEVLAERFPDARLEIIQPSWNTGVGTSEGTHDKCACFDVRIVGLDWFVAQRFLRELGWAGWVRVPPAFSLHIHMISLGCQQVKGLFVDGGLSQFGELRSSSQIKDYYAHAFGLENQHEPGSDTSWFPADIDSTVFDYQTYMEAHMPLNADDKAWITDAINKAFADFAKNAGALIKLDADDDPTTAKTSLEREIRAIKNKV